MGYKSLDQEEVDRFVRDGYAVVREAFPRDFAQCVRGWLWKELALPPDDPAAWTKPLIHLETRFSGPEAAPAFSPMLFGAFDDLLGEGRWARLEDRLGGWMIAFPGHDAPPLRPPEPSWFHIEELPRQRLGQGQIAITLICLFSDIDPGDGGTAVALGSHRIAARELAAAGAEGLANDELERRVRRHTPELPVAEITGRAGDVAILHGLTAHCRSKNTGKKVRFVCNPNYPLKEPMRLGRADLQERTPLERSVLEALSGGR